MMGNRKLPVMINDPDVALMIRFQEGDESAFRQLYERYKKKIINYCFRFTGCEAIAEELTQETLIRVYRGAPGYRPESRFSTWIFKIATNVCLKEIGKKEYRTPRISLDTPYYSGHLGENREMELPDTTTPGPERSVEDRERMKRIHHAVSALPPHQKAALLLCTVEGFSYAQVADQIGKTVSGVKSLIHRARQHLATVLDRE